MLLKNVCGTCLFKDIAILFLIMEIMVVVVVVVDLVEIFVVVVVPVEAVIIGYGKPHSFKKYGKPTSAHVRLVFHGGGRASRGREDRIYDYWGGPNHTEPCSLKKYGKSASTPQVSSTQATPTSTITTQLPLKFS